MLNLKWLWERVFGRVKVGEIYFNPRTGKFLQIREVGKFYREKDRKVICGPATTYYGDAVTANGTLILPLSQLKREWRRVVALDRIPGIFYDGIGWRILEKNKPTPLVEGGLYFDPKTSRYFEIREIRGNIIIVSPFVRYPEDASSVIGKLPLSRKYVESCWLIENKVLINK